LFERAVHALSDVARLLLDRDHDAARVGVEAELAARVADVAHDVAGDGPDIDIGRGRDLAHHDDQAGGDCGLAGHAGIGVVGQNGIQDCVRDLITDLVRMALGDRFRREE